MKNLISMKSYIYIEPYCFVSASSTFNKAIIYNTITSNTIVLVDETIVNMCRQLGMSSNPIIECTADMLNNASFNLFVKELRDNFCGDLVKSGVCKPVILSPNLYYSLNCSSLYMKKSDYAIKQRRELLYKINEINLNDCPL